MTEHENLHQRKHNFTVSGFIRITLHFYKDYLLFPVRKFYFDRQHILRNQKALYFSLLIIGLFASFSKKFSLQNWEILFFDWEDAVNR